MTTPGLTTAFALMVLCATSTLAEDPSAAVCEERSDPLPRSVVFVNGYEALEETDFGTAALWMDCADGNWREEDYYGETYKDKGAYVRVNRYLAKPYLPKYYLGKSLYKAGCYAAAREKLEQTLLADPGSAASRRERHLRTEFSQESKACRAKKECKQEGADCARWPAKAESCPSAEKPPHQDPQGGG